MKHKLDLKFHYSNGKNVRFLLIPKSQFSWGKVDWWRRGWIGGGEGGGGWGDDAVDLVTFKIMKWNFK